jgi:hypothetical protein
LRNGYIIEPPGKTGEGSEFRVQGKKDEITGVPNSFIVVVVVVLPNPGGDNSGIKITPPAEQELGGTAAGFAFKLGLS